MTAPNDLIQIGFIRGAHALKGQVSVHVFSGNEEALLDYGSVFNADGSKAYAFRIDGVKQGDFLCSLKGVTDRNTAEALKGTRLYVSASALPELDEDEFYYKDLIGLTVLDAKGTFLGKVKNVNSFGAHDALDIEFINTGEQELPKPQNEFLLFTKVNVPEVNIQAGTVIAELPFGMFETPEEEK